MLRNPAAEPFRIKVVEPLKITTEAERLAVLQSADYNIFHIPAEEVFIDLLTDSGTSAMSQYQWAGLMTGDESYAYCRNWYHLEDTIREITGYKHILPTHQGRPAENILTLIHIEPGQKALANMFFDTTQANVASKGGIPCDLVVEEGLHAEGDFPFKGNLDIQKLEDILRTAMPGEIAFVLATVTCNNNGGQPVSMANLREIRRVASQYGLPFYLDAARFAENAYFIQQREPGYAGKSIREIAHEMFSYADGCTMSAKKDGLVNIGGFLALNDEEKFRKAQQYLILMEGYITYGGMAGRDLEALSIGLNEVLEEPYMANRVRQVHYLGKQLMDAGVPIIHPTGGHCIMLDMKGFLPHLTQDQFPAEAFTAALYLDSGTRAVGLGHLAFGSVDAVTGETVYSPLEVVRLTIPRRVYTDNHMDLVAASVIHLFQNREQIKGMEVLWAPPALRHFTAKMRPVGK